MHKKAESMDNSLISRPPVYREQKFRQPSDLERGIGLWVDRVGEETTLAGQPRLRILGQYAAVFVVEGEGWFESRTIGRVAVSRHTALLLFPDEPARYGPDVEWRTEWVVWNGEDAAHLEKCGYLTPKRPVLPDTLQAVRQAHAELKPIINLEGRDAALRRKIVVLNMVQLLYRALLHNRRRADGRIEEAARFLSEHAAEPFSLPRAAARAHLSAAQFRRLFTDYTGMGPLRFVTAQRVARAKELLAAGAPIKTAGARAGFRDVFHFMRVFKRTTGVTAGQFVAGNTRLVDAEKTTTPESC